MTEKLRQSLSAAIDDEADAFELRRVLDELGRDTELRSLWDRYHIIGSAVRGDRIPVPPGLRERVWEALETHPDQDQVVTASSRPEVDADDTAPAPAAAAGSPSYLGRYTGLAVAATVAFAVVLGFNGWSGDEVSRAGLAGGDAGGAVVAGQVPPSVSLPEAGPGMDLGSEVSASDVQRAQAYMLHHTQQQAINQAGVMSFVKLATYEAP